MPRLTPVDPAKADPKQKELLDAVEKKMGGTPNIIRTMVQSPAVLKAYLSFNEALGEASLDGKVREQIALATAGVNGCGYCASAHTAAGKKQGLSDEDAKAALTGDASDPKAKAAVNFARALVEKKGWVDDSDVKAARDAGFQDKQIAEIIATVAINSFTNYFNHVAETELDFPKVEMPEPVAR